MGFRLAGLHPGALCLDNEQATLTVMSNVLKIYWWKNCVIYPLVGGQACTRNSRLIQFNIRIYEWTTATNTSYQQWWSVRRQLVPVSRRSRQQSVGRPYAALYRWTELELSATGKKQFDISLHDHCGVHKYSIPDEITVKKNYRSMPNMQ